MIKDNYKHCFYLIMILNVFLYVILPYFHLISPSLIFLKAKVSCYLNNLFDLAIFSFLNFGLLQPDQNRLFTQNWWVILKVVIINFLVYIIVAIKVYKVTQLCLKVQDICWQDSHGVSWDVKASWFLHAIPPQLLSMLVNSQLSL